MKLRSPSYRKIQPLAKCISRALGLAVASVCLFDPSTSQAASGTWTNGTADNNWQSIGNWSGGAFPGLNSNVFTSVEDATFGSVGASGAINLGDVINVRSLLFGELGANAASFSIGDANDVLNLTSAGGVTVNAGVTTAQTIGTTGTTINLSNVAGATATFTNNGTGLLTIGGNIVGNVASGNGLLTVTGSGNTTVTGSIAKPGAGSLALLKTGAGILTLSNGSTWSGAGAIGNIPAAAGFPLVVREGTLLLNGGTHNVNGEAVIGGVVTNGGAGQNAKIQIDSGTLAINGYLSVGRGNGIGGVSSDLVANNNAIITATNFSAGYNGNNAANLSKGTITLNNSSSFTVSGNGAFNLAESAGSNMTLTLNNSAQVLAVGTSTKFIGNLGTGTLNINGTSLVDLGGVVYVGYRTGTGTVTMTGGTLNTAGEVRVGGSDLNGAGINGSGTMTFSGGLATLNALTVARGNNNQNTVTGSVTVSGTADVRSVNDVVLGFAGAANLGKLTINGGSFTVGTAAAKWLQVGVWDTAKGQLDITGGNLNLWNNSSLKMNIQTGTGGNVINQSGGTVTFYSNAGTAVGGTGVLDLQTIGAAASVNTYNLDGGTLIVPQIVSTGTSGTRAFNFNGGVLKAAGTTGAFINLGTGNARANVRNNGAIIDTNGQAVTSTQVLLHSNIGGDNAIDGGFTKQGSGVLTLSNSTNTYTGATTVTGGTLTLAGTASVNTSNGIVINGAGAKLVHTGTITITPAITVTQGTLDGTGTVGSVTVGAGTGGIVANGNGTSSKFTLGSLTFAGAGAISASVAGGGTFSEGIGITGALTTSGGTVTVNATPTSAWVDGNTYNLVSYGSLVGSVTDFTKGTIGLLGPRQAATLNHDTTNKFITLSITGDSPKWTGLDGNAWVVGATGANSNWKLITAGTATDYISGDGVLFDDTAASTAITINAANVSPTATTFNNSSVDYTVSGSFGIVGAGTLIKNGTRDLTINTANSYSGSTIVNGGNLTVTNAASLGNTSSVTLGAGSTLKIQTAADSSIPVVISGGGGISKAGASTWTLGNANTYSGTTTITEGVLVGGANASFGGNNAPVLIDGGTLRASAGFTNTHPITIGAAGATIHVAAAQYYFTTINTLLGSGTLTLIGNGTLTGANTSGNLRVDKTNTYSGNMIVRDGGIFEYGAAGAVSAAATFAIGNEGEVAVQTGAALPNAISINGGTKSTLSFENGNTGNFSGPITLNANAVFALRDWYNYNTARSGIVSGVISGSGGISVNSGNATTGVLSLTNANTYTGTTTITSGTLQLGNGGTTGSISTLSPIVSNGTFATNRTNAVIQGIDFSPAPISGTGGFAVSGTGNVTDLNATNTFTGITTVNNGATLVLSGNNTLSTGNVVLNNGSTLRLLAHFDNTTAGVSNVLGSNPAAGNSGFQLGNNSSGTVGIQLRSDSNVAFANTTTGNNSGNVTLNFDVNNLGAVNGSGPTGKTLTFAPANETGRNNGNGLSTFNTNINVSGGNDYTLAIGKVVGVGNQTTINANTADVVLGSFGTTNSANTFNIGGASDVTVTDGVSPGTGGSIVLNKTGTGILTLAGASTYAGATNVNGGILTLAGTLTGTASLNVSSATVQLGTDNAINDFATLALTSSIFAVNGVDETLSTLTLNTGASTFNFGSGSSIFHFADSSAIAWTGTLSVLGWDGTATTGGGVDQLFFGSSNSALTSAQIASIQFVDPAGYAPGTYGAEMLANGEIVAAVPEPTAVASLLGGLGVLLGARRSRRRQS